jgi:predicted nuclease with TOPRIM domain
MSYYQLLKFFFHFIKKAYFNSLFKEKDLINKTINTYNEIYDFRERVGEMHNNLCKLENLIFIDDQNENLKGEYKILKQEFELKCRNYFLQISKPYYKYLTDYFKLV